MLMRIWTTSRPRSGAERASLPLPTDASHTPKDEPYSGAHPRRRQVVMMRNHGVLTLGRTVGEAFTLMLHVEKAARMQVLAQSTGGELVLPPAAFAEEVAEGCAHMGVFGV
mmetsp:Transcript_69285/g.219258  ORF Transcript_69285/g.219258 Transcript_69285/m.219258 type:complete len:111 (+) Transcript_69285:185-517(+)